MVPLRCPWLDPDRRVRAYRTRRCKDELSQDWRQVSTENSVDSTDHIGDYDGKDDKHTYSNRDAYAFTHYIRTSIHW